jgi:hypothetical protein
VLLHQKYGWDGSWWPCMMINNGQETSEKILHKNVLMCQPSTPLSCTGS